MLHIQRIDFRSAATFVQVAGNLDLVRGVEKDLVLQDFLEHDFHLVIRDWLDQRTASGVELDQAFLNQRGELKAAANFVDDFFFFQDFMHRLLFSVGDECAGIFVATAGVYVHRRYDLFRGKGSGHMMVRLPQTTLVH
jgi:hypothetical protein